MTTQETNIDNQQQNKQTQVRGMKTPRNWQCVNIAGKGRKVQLAMALWKECPQNVISEEMSVLNVIRTG